MYATVLEAMGRKRAPLTMRDEVALAQQHAVEGVLYAFNALVKVTGPHGERVRGNTDTILCVTPRRVLATGANAVVIDVPFERIADATQVADGDFTLVADGVRYDVSWMLRSRLDRAFSLITERIPAGRPAIAPAPASAGMPAAMPVAAPSDSGTAGPAVDAGLFADSEAGRRIAGSLHALAAAARRSEGFTFPDGEPVAPALDAVVLRTQQYFTRLRAKAVPQQVRVAETTYADVLVNAERITAADYLGDLLVHPELWDDADERALAVARLLADTAERLVRDTRRLNAAADLDLQVAKAALAQTTAADDLEALYTPGARP